MKVPEIIVSYRVIRPESYTPIICNNSWAIFDVLKGLFCSDTFDWTEEMLMLCFNRRHEIMCYSKISNGGITGTVCDVRKVLLIALQAQATSIVLSHNHPSGNLKPSQSDLAITKQMKAACDVMEIKLLDHLIITCDTYYSFADEGEL